MRRSYTILVLLLTALPALADETVIPLKTDSGVAPNRDTRTWRLPVRCNDVDAEFTWGCSGWTIIGETFARQAKLRISLSIDLDGYVDAAGKPMFLGEADVAITIGKRTTKTTAMVMRDAEYNRGLTGTLGYDVARQYQWEINPAAATLTLRPPRTAPASRPIAILPLKDEKEDLWINVKIRNVAVDVRLMPQNSDLTAGPDLQNKWDLSKARPEDVKTFLGGVRSAVLTGRSLTKLAPGLTEMNVYVILVGDPDKPAATPGAKSGIGASLLNRFVYCVDADLKQFRIMSRVRPPASQP